MGGEKISDFFICDILIVICFVYIEICPAIGSDSFRKALDLCFMYCNAE